MDIVQTRNLKALVHLLDEPDVDVFQEIKERIFSYGEDALEILECEWESTLDQSLQSRIENIIHSIQLNRTKTNLLKWKASQDRSLLEAYLILTRYQYQEIDKELLISNINKIKDAIWLELNDKLTSLEKVKVMNHMIFEVFKFKGTKASIDSVSHAMLNNLMETKNGSPLSLSMLYLILAKQLKLPIYGVLLPNNLILAYSRHFLNNISFFDESIDEIIFYINPFKNGAIFTRNEIDLYLNQINTKPKASFYAPCETIDIVIAFLANLALLFESRGDKGKAEEVQELLNILKK